MTLEVLLPLRSPANDTALSPGCERQERSQIANVDYAAHIEEFIQHSNNLQQSIKSLQIATQDVVKQYQRLRAQHAEIWKSIFQPESHIERLSSIELLARYNQSNIALCSLNAEIALNVARSQMETEPHNSCLHGDLQNQCTQLLEAADELRALNDTKPEPPTLLSRRENLNAKAFFYMVDQSGCRKNRKATRTARSEKYFKEATDLRTPRADKGNIVDSKSVSGLVGMTWENLLSQPDPIPSLIDLYRTILAQNPTHPHPAPISLTSDGKVTENRPEISSPGDAANLQSNASLNLNTFQCPDENNNGVMQELIATNLNPLAKLQELAGETSSSSEALIPPHLSGQSLTVTSINSVCLFPQSLQHFHNAERQCTSAHQKTSSPTDDHAQIITFARSILTWYNAQCIAYRAQQCYSEMRQIFSQFCIHIDDHLQNVATDLWVRCAESVSTSSTIRLNHRLAGSKNRSEDRGARHNVMPRRFKQLPNASWLGCIPSRNRKRAEWEALRHRLNEYAHKKSALGDAIAAVPITSPRNNWAESSRKVCRYNWAESSRKVCRCAVAIIYLLITDRALLAPTGADATCISLTPAKTLALRNNRPLIETEDHWSQACIS